jgi:hypothetical protein
LFATTIVVVPAAVVAMVAAWGRISTATADVFDDQFDFRR